MLARYIQRLPRNTASLSSLAAAAEPQLSDIRTNEINTALHTEKHIGKFYQISAEDKKQLFAHGGFPKTFDQQVKTFGESCLMIRQPAVEILDYIKATNFKNPTVRYVLYGEDGVGKSLTMAHLLHYGLQNDFVIVHVPWVANWFKRAKETANSSTVEGSIDLPFDAAAWLVHFKTQNAKILPKLNLKTTKNYVWSKRETTPLGSNLIELIEHGIARVKFAPDTVAALISELKEHATNDQCKVMVAIDGYNAFFHPNTRIVDDNKAKVTPDRVTLTKPFLDITNYDWSNGVCILAVDRIALTEERMESCMPRYQLGKEGFEHCDPFIPIKVDNYSEKEFQSCIDYYLNRKWIQTTEKGFDNELKFLSNKNPYRLMKMCAPL